MVEGQWGYATHFTLAVKSTVLEPHITVTACKVSSFTSET